MEQTPTIGRIVIYNTTASERDSNDFYINQAKQLPAMIVSVAEDPNVKNVNLKVFADGPRDKHVAQVSQGDKEGQWNWPTIIKKAVEETTGSEIAEAFAPETTPDEQKESSI